VGYSDASNFGEDVEAGEQWIKDVIGAQINLTLLLMVQRSFLEGLKKLPAAMARVI
jgi:hypothetical protein